MKFLVIYGHKYYPYSEGRLNKTLFDEILKVLGEDGHEVETTIVENGYSVEKEIEKFKRADIIIFQTPINWFSVPWVLKKYFDEVYQYGVFYEPSENYGQGGLFKGKKYMYSLTCNTPFEEMDNPNGFFNGRSLEDVIIALHKVQEFAGMSPAKSYCAFDAVHRPNIPRYLKELRNHINTYVLDRYIS